MYAFGTDSSQELKNLSTSVLQYQHDAAKKCPQLVEKYNELASSIAYEMNINGSFTPALANELKQLNEYCSKNVSTASLKAPASGSSFFSALPLIAIVGIAAVLMMKK